MIDNSCTRPKNTKNVTKEDFDKYDGVYSLTAIKSYTRLFRVHYDDRHSTKDAIELFNEVGKMRSVSSLITVFTSDDWDSFEERLVNVYGKIELPQYKGIGKNTT